MRHRRGFTLLELLVVISIIVVLISLLLPTIAKVRQQAHATSTKAQITSLATAMQAYSGDFGSFPGPVPNATLGLPACGISGAVDQANNPIAGWDVTKMSMAENAYLGLCGGLVKVTDTNFVYSTAQAGNGPLWLGVTPKKLPKYADNVNISSGFYKDGNDTPANDTIIHEFLDKFPEAMPMLILRARVKAPGVATISNVPPPPQPAQQYDVEQINSYTESEIGVGRTLGQGEVKGYSAEIPTPFHPFHGLRTANPDATNNDPPTPPGPEGALRRFYPYDLYAALIDPTLTRVAATVTAPANSPRQKDGFIIISAGIDRVYGTPDDIANFDRY